MPQVQPGGTAASGGGDVPRQRRDVAEVVEPLHDPAEINAIISADPRIPTNNREIVLRLIDGGYVAGTDPYGKAWKPPKDGHTPPMIRSGKLRGGYTVRIVKTGNVGYSIEINNTMHYSEFLQKGTSRMEARLHAPGAALPPVYKALFKQCYDEAIARWWARRGG